MKVAIIGTGISGLTCARRLADHHEVTVFEARSRIGGHTNTVPVTVGERQFQIDTGFIVYNERTYPHFTRLLDELRVNTQPTSMSFSVRCDRTGLEYNGTNLNGVFAQRRNLMRPSFLRLLRDILKFNRRGPTDVHKVPTHQTVGQYMDEHGFSQQFAEQYLLPMGAAIWSCPSKTFAEFPIHFILEFYHNHGLLALSNRPVWRVIEGGSKNYLPALTEPFRDRIRTSCPVKSVRRCEDHVDVSFEGGEESFDEVVFACHSNQALQMLADPDAEEVSLLSAFPWSRNTAVLHTDESVLPKRRRAWASWNYRIGREEETRPTVTYNMNILQGIKSETTFCVTLNDDNINPELIHGTFEYEHPVFTTSRATWQARHNEFIRRRRTSFCGAWWRNGFHEDGVVSALTVAQKFGSHEPPLQECSPAESNRGFT
ncbi:MAG TPA: FAD-dependent oxidoreductase [Planctomycetaceae bacterium]|nr:FAD-dependent oxidoreductase [Planctomycetaceae bacterium]